MRLSLKALRIRRLTARSQPVAVAREPVRQGGFVEWLESYRNRLERVCAAERPKRSGE